MARMSAFNGWAVMFKKAVNYSLKHLAIELATWALYITFLVWALLK